MRTLMVWFFANPEDGDTPISSINLYELSEGEDFGDYIDKWVLDHPFDINAVAYKQHRVVVTSYRTILKDGWTWIPDDADWDEYPDLVQSCETCKFFDNKTLWCSQYNDTTYHPNCSSYKAIE